VDARKAMAIGGGATAVATLAVATAIAWTSAAALSDSPGAPLAAAAVVVPAPKVTSTASPAPPTATPTPVQTPVTVPAPEPGIVESHPAQHTTSGTTASHAPAPSTPVKTTVPRSAPSASTPPKGDSDWRAWEHARELIAKAVKTGDWNEVRAWARSLGWSDKQIDAWIALWKARYGSGHTGFTAPTSTVGQKAGSVPSTDSGSKREQPLYTPN